VVVVVAGSIAINILAYRHAYAMMHFTAGNPRTQEPEKLTLGQKVKVLLRGVNIPRPQTRASPLDLGPATRSLRLDDTNGITLGAWYCPGPAQSPLVILFHGYTSEKSGTLPEAKTFLEMGLSVLLVDFRGSGDSSESYTTVGFDEAEDVAAAVRYAHAYLPQRKVILYGQSMGAAAILRAVHSCGVQPDAIIVEAMFDRMLNTVRHRFEAMGVPSFLSAELLVFWGGRQAGFNGFGHNPVQYAASVDCPILFLHGAADPRAHIEEARRVFAVVHAPKRFREFPAIGHEASVVRFPGEWKEAVAHFLGEVDGAASGRQPMLSE
jgi:alpha-beta hydrolase superfamily lysophospholipase